MFKSRERTTFSCKTDHFWRSESVSRQSIITYDSLFVSYCNNTLIFGCRKTQTGKMYRTKIYSNLTNIAFSSFVLKNNWIFILMYYVYHKLYEFSEYDIPYYLFCIFLNTTLLWVILSRHYFRYWFHIPSSNKKRIFCTTHQQSFKFSVRYKYKIIFRRDFSKINFIYLVCLLKIGLFKLA